MNTQRVGWGLLSNCSRLLVRVGRNCKNYIFDDKAEQEWAEFAWMEAVAELSVQQRREARERIVRRNR